MKKQPDPKSVRCAIYTRKSTEEGLDQEFNSLDAQRESAEAFVASQRSEGWQCLPARYDDGGFTGGNLQRPAVQRLLADIEAGHVDCVVVYKVDRLSRSLLDFARMMAVFERHGVSFVSVTQQFNTATSMGRLMLNVLLSFAQFEREMISERTRDKMGAARRKGKRLGGMPVLGYDVDAVTRKLVVNSEEAGRVRAIFQLYLESGGITATVRELRKRGWVTKRWTTRKGKVRGGRPFNRAALHYLLTNVTYLGRVKYHDQIYDGEHAAVVSPEVFRQARELLTRNRRTRRRPKTTPPRGLLEDLLVCAACDARMVHTYTARGTRRYFYYVCSSAQQHGRETCPTESLPAEQIERFVWDEVAGERRLGAWDDLSTAERAERLAAVVRRIEYDGAGGDLAIRLHGNGEEPP